MQLWARARAPAGAQGICVIEPRHLAVLHRGPRLLLVRCTAGFLRCVIVVAHAPSGRGGAEARQAVDSFWKELSATVAGACRGHPVVLLMDANARVGSTQGAAVGPVDAVAEDPPGTAMRGTLEERGLFLPATFFGVAGEGDTWTATDGHRHRIDYVAIPESWRCMVVSAFIPPGVDLALSREDHRCAAVEVSGTFRRGEEAPPPGPRSLSVGRP